MDVGDLPFRRVSAQRCVRLADVPEIRREEARARPALEELWPTRKTSWRMTSDTRSLAPTVVLVDSNLLCPFRNLLSPYECP
jgi:hypothetical protein